MRATHCMQFLLARLALHDCIQDVGAKAEGETVL